MTRADGIPPRSLCGVRVLDLTRWLSGPYCTMLLADAGADVIKIEPPGGEIDRWLEPLLQTNDNETTSGYFLRLNRNKLSKVIDLKTEQGNRVFTNAVKEADVLVENFRPGVMERMGFSWDQLHSLNPRLIYCTISGFGYSGPYKQRPAFNQIVEMMAGVWSGRDEDGYPHPVGLAVGDLVPAINAVAGISMALFERENTGFGNRVDIAMYDSMVALNEISIATKNMTGEDYRIGSEVNPNFSPYGAFQTKDGFVAINVATNLQWSSLCRLMGKTDWGNEERFESGERRAALFRDVIRPVLLDWLKERYKEEVSEELTGAGIPAGPVRGPAEVMNCPQVEARGMLVPVWASGIDQYMVPNTAIRVGDRVDRTGGRVPELDSSVVGSVDAGVC